jgi:hypothetical protein
MTGGRRQEAGGRRQEGKGFYLHEFNLLVRFICGFLILN